MMQKIIPVILSGGSGTRLWPASRARRPKQLLSITAPESLLQLTARRASDPERFAAPLIVANLSHAEQIEDQLADVGAVPGMVILEPVARNTAPAIALAALAVEPDALLLVMPSDHMIADVDAFRRAIDAAEPLAGAGWMVTFGIAPNSPNTGYGYIRAGEELGASVRRVEQYVEKPDRATAEAYLAQGCYAWNSGIFLFRAGVYLAALEALAPEMADAARAAVSGARRENRRLYAEADAFAASPSESIDYAVMEKATQVAMVNVDMGWSDVGTWDALHDLADKDAHGNVNQGEIVCIDTSNCLIRSTGPLVAVVGMEDLIVVATADAVLITRRGNSQDVQRVVATLKKTDNLSLT